MVLELLPEDLARDPEELRGLLTMPSGPLQRVRQMLTLVLVALYPPTATWLPEVLFGW